MDDVYDDDSDGDGDDGDSDGDSDGGGGGAGRWLISLRSASLFLTTSQIIFDLRL